MHVIKVQRHGSVQCVYPLYKQTICTSAYFGRYQQYFILRLSVPHPNDSRVCNGYDSTVTSLLGCNFNGILKA